MKIAIGLSGGVDSTIAAHLLKEEGHELIGLTMKLWNNSMKLTQKKSACFGPDEVENIEETQKIADHLKIPLHIIDLSKEFSEKILGYFKEEYLAGRTPNPCVKCNQLMKFDLLIKKALEQEINFDFFATGHYAQIIKDESSNKFLLKKGVDEKKDQSYFLSLLNQEQLSKIIFPLGEYTKEKIKKISKKLNLKVHEKKESQDFFSGDYNDLLDKLPESGNIIKKDGEILGKHKGICYYTIGQRKGLGISYKEPLYVIGIDKKTNSIIAGTEEELYKKSLTASKINWISIDKLDDPIKVKTKIRYMHKETDSIIKNIGQDQVKVIFDKPQKAIAPGQFAVFYNNDIVVGSGIID